MRATPATEPCVLESLLEILYKSSLTINVTRVEQLMLFSDQYVLYTDYNTRISWRTPIQWINILQGPSEDLNSVHQVSVSEYRNLSLKNLSATDDNFCH